MGNLFDKTINEQESHSRQLAEPDRQTARIIVSSQPIEFYGPITIVDTQGIGSAFTLNHVDKGLLSGTTTLGTEGKDAVVGQRVIPPTTGTNYDYRDWFDSTLRIDTSNSTASVVAQEGLFASGETLRSKIIFDNNVTITAATWKTAGTFSGGGTPTYYLSADSTNWEVVTIDTEHEFTNTGTELSWRIDVAGATGTITIDSSGVETPIKIITTK